MPTSNQSDAAGPAWETRMTCDDCGNDMLPGNPGRWCYRCAAKHKCYYCGTVLDGEERYVCTTCRKGKAFRAQNRGHPNRFRTEAEAEAIEANVELYRRLVEERGFIWEG